MMQIILATNNQHKVSELSDIFAQLRLPISLISQKEWFNGNSPEIEETGLTLEENALLKARALHAMTGMPVIADDTGLEITALNNAPGVFSARFAGEHGNDSANRHKVLTLMHDNKDRTARFRTILYFLDESVSFACEGSCTGHIALEESGIHGFGYDAIFIPDGHIQTFADMESSIKQSMSHRAKACIQLGESLSRYINP
ncbi:MAG: RdgB/HAM1 family non-canonical purine NTP pyrophosphatase [bacterium]